MKRYKAKWLTELQRFERANTCTKPPTRSALGRKQFHEHESRGVRPQQPDPYYVYLLDGKKWWEWTLNACAALYASDEWPGWHQLEIDFKDDPAGLKQLRARVRSMP